MDEWPSVREAVGLYAQGWFPMDDLDRAGEPLPFYAAHERAIFPLDATRGTRCGAGCAARCGARADCELVRDRHFDAVLTACAAPRAEDDERWITPRLAGLYRRLHAAGVAHSYELVRGGELAAGVLAVRLGRAAMLESMCHFVPDAGNALLAAPARRARGRRGRGAVRHPAADRPHAAPRRRADRPRRLRGAAARACDQLSDGSAGIVDSSASDAPWRRRTADHSSSGSSQKTSSRSAGTTIHDSSSISASSWPGPQPAWPAKIRARRSASPSAPGSSTSAGTKPRSSSTSSAL